MDIIYTSNIDNFRRTDEEKPTHGYYPQGIYTFNHYRYLLKETNFHCFYNNEVYALSLARVILGDDNSTECILVLDNNKWKIASKLIHNTENIYQFLENNKKCYKPSENFISIILTSIILNNIDPNSTNILIHDNGQKNKFYLIDPLIISQNNKFGIDANKLENNINILYRNFTTTTNKSNIKQNILILFKGYFQICNDQFLKKVISWIKNYMDDCENKISNEIRIKNEKTIGYLEKVSNKNDEMISEILENLINSMDDQSIIKEISTIKGIDDQQKQKIEKIGNYFESDDVFPDFGSLGIKKGYYNEVFEKIKQLKNIELSSIQHSSSKYSDINLVISSA
jgi:hypothetical protein